MLDLGELGPQVIGTKETALGLVHVLADGREVLENPQGSKFDGVIVHPHTLSLQGLARQAGPLSSDSEPNYGKYH